MERANIIKISLALITAILTVLAMAAPAMADHYSGAGDRCSWDKDKYDRMGKEKDVYMTIAIDGRTGNTTTFSVMDMAMKGKTDKAVLIKPGAPLTGTYNTSNDMGYISTASFMPATMTIDTVNNTSVPVAGGSAVMGVHDMKVLTKEEGYKVFQFGRVTFFTPNGTAMTYNLDKPVRVTYEKDRKIVVVDAYPSFTSVLADVFGTGATFASDAPPVPLNSLVTAKSAVTAQTVGYQKPAYVPPPK